MYHSLDLVWIYDKVSVLSEFIFIILSNISFIGPFSINIILAKKKIYVYIIFYNNLILCK